MCRARRSDRSAPRSRRIAPHANYASPVDSPDTLFEQNRAWARRMVEDDPSFFDNLAHGQRPQWLWIGCSDSRVPANQVVGLQPGEIFVHRNVGNIVVHTDLNCLSVLQYAVDVLEVQHVIVCGHYGCGGIGAALSGARLGLVDNWLRHVVDVADKHRAELDALDESARQDRLAELNVIEQVTNVCETTIVRDAWQRGTGALGARLDLRDRRRAAAGPRRHRRGRAGRATRLTRTVGGLTRARARSPSGSSRTGLRRPRPGRSGRRRGRRRRRGRAGRGSRCRPAARAWDAAARR